VFRSSRLASEPHDGRSRGNELAQGAGDLVKCLKDAAAARSGYYGRHKELGPLADFGQSYGARPKVKAAIERAIAEHYAAVRGSAPERS
jgi:hypothetical protein